MDIRYFSVVSIAEIQISNLIKVLRSRVGPDPSPIDMIPPTNWFEWVHR